MTMSGARRHILICYGAGSGNTAAGNPHADAPACVVKCPRRKGLMSELTAASKQLLGIREIKRDSSNFESSMWKNE